jgi:hypothetical protein
MQKTVSMCYFITVFSPVKPPSKALESPSKTGFETQILFVCSVRLLDKYSKVLQKARYIEQDYTCPKSKNRTAMIM